MSANPQDPWHAHVYYDKESWGTAQLLHQQLSDMLANGTCAGLVIVGQMYDRGVGPHLQPQWIGEPLPLDVSVLDPPGHNQGIARFGKVEF